MDTTAGEANELRTWSLFGLRLASDHPFLTQLHPTDGEPELTLRSVSAAPLPPGWERLPSSYASPAMIDDEQHFLTIVTTERCTVFRFTEVVDFFVFGDEILCHLHDSAYAYMVELHFLGFVMAYWFERRGAPAIHAAAVVVDDAAIGFLSTNKGGKSSLAASFMQGGHPLLTDDILAIERAGEHFVARPSYPQMRMWPEQAQHFVGDAASLAQVHPRLSKRRVPVGPHGLGAFCDAKRRLRRLYVPERQDGGEITFTTLPFGEAVFALARYSFLTDIVEHVGLHRSRFAVLADLVRTVGVRRVAYPSGMERLPEVVRAIQDDARAAG